jgi:uncharacterized protein (TIGR03067 family)
MSIKIVTRHVVFGAAILFAALVTVADAQSLEKVAAPKWDFRAVAFGNDEKENTKKLNDLAREGWEYVGPLGNAMVAFKRRIRSVQEIELEKLQGTWTLISYEMDGKQIKGEDEDHTFTFLGDKWIGKDGGQLVQAGTIKRIEVKDKFNTMGLLITEAVNAGATAIAIYVLEGETLKYIVTTGGPRPTEFATKEGDDRHYLTRRRAKP